MPNPPGQVLKLKDLFQISGWQKNLKWQPFCPGVDIYRLYEHGPDGPTAALLRFHPGGRVPQQRPQVVKEILKNRVGSMES
jgi:hypothetical protein